MIAIHVFLYSTHDIVYYKLQTIFSFIGEILVFGVQPDIFSYIGAVLVLSSVVLLTFRNYIISLPIDNPQRVRFNFLTY